MRVVALDLVRVALALSLALAFMRGASATLTGTFTWTDVAATTCTNWNLPGIIDADSSVTSFAYLATLTLLSKSSVPLPVRETSVIVVQSGQMVWGSSNLADGTAGITTSYGPSDWGLGNRFNASFFMTGGWQVGFGYGTVASSVSNANLYIGYFRVTVQQTWTVVGTTMSPLTGAAGTVVTISPGLAPALRSGCQCSFGGTSVLINAASQCTAPAGSGTVPFAIVCGIYERVSNGTHQFVYTTASALAIGAISPSIIGVAAVPLTMTLNGTVTPGSNVYIAFSISDCAAIVSPTAVLAMTFSISSRPTAAGVYSVCLSTTGASGVFVKQTPRLTVFGESSSIVTGIAVLGSTTAVIGRLVSDAPTFVLTLNSFALFTADARLALATDTGCTTRVAGTESGPFFASTTPGATFLWTPPLFFVPSTSPLYVCFSSSGGTTWSQQTSSAAQVTTVSSGCTSISPTTLAVGSLGPITVTGAAVASRRSRIAFSTTALCPASFAASSVMPVTDIGTVTFTLSVAPEFTAPPPALTQTVYVCVSVADGLANSWASTGLSVLLVTVRAGAVTSVSPAAVVADVPRALTIMPISLVNVSTIQTAFTTDGASCATLCAGTATTSVPTAYTVPASCGPVAYLCLALPTIGSTLPTWLHQGTNSAVQVASSASPAAIISITSSAARLASGVSTTLMLSAPANSAAFSPRIAFARPGGCGDSASRQNEVSWSSTVSVTITVPADAAPPLSVYALCFGYGVTSTLGPWVEQFASVEVVVATPLTFTSVSPVTIANGTVPSLAVTGARASPTSLARLAVVGSGCALTVAGTAPISADNLIVFPQVLNTLEPIVALCLSVNSGGVYVEQAAVTMATTLDLLAGVVLAVTPRVLGAGQSGVTLAVTTTSAVASTTLAFSSTTCLSPVGFVHSSVFTGPAATVGPFVVTSVGGRYIGCYLQAPATVYSQQILSPSSLLVVAASTGSIAAVSPSVLGENAVTTLTLVASTNTPLGSLATLACTGCMIAFAPSTAACSSAPARVAAPFTMPNNENNTVDGSFSVVMSSSLGVPSDGSLVFKLCFSSNGGTNWFDQTVSMVILPMSGASVSALVPAVVGRAFAVSFTASGAPLSVLSTFALASSSCASPIAGTRRAISSSNQFTLDTTMLAPGTYLVCFSVNNATFVEQSLASLRVVDALATTITTVSPSVIPALAVNALTLTTSLSFFPATTALAFVPFGSSCASTRVGLTMVSSPAVSVPAFDLTVAANYSTCLTTSLGLVGETWVLQTAPATLVLVAVVNANTFSAFTPGRWGVGLPVTATLTPTSASLRLPVASTRIALAPLSCAIGRTGESSLNTVSYTATIAALNAPSLFRVCVSIDAGVSWVLLVSSITAELVSMLPGTVVDLSPGLIGADIASASFAIASIQPGSGAQVAFTLASSGCSGLATTLIFPSTGVAVWSPPLVPPAPAVYAMCASYDSGANWVRQTVAATALAVEAATPTSITSITPGGLAVGVSGATITVSGFVPLVSSRLALSPPGRGCAPVDVPFFEQTLDVSGPTNVPLVSSLASEGRYTLCYSVNEGNAYVAQTSPGLTFSGVRASAWDVLAIVPSYIPQAVSGVRVALTLNATRALVPTAQIGFAALPLGCAGGSVLSVSAASSSVLLTGALVSAGSYELCFTVNGAQWVVQQAAGLITVGLATSASLVAPVPSVIDRASLTQVALPGLVPSALTRVAFVQVMGPAPTGPLAGPPGGCADPSSWVGEVSYPLTDASPTVPLNLVETGVYGVCYSLDAGTTWVFQNGTAAARLGVTDCLAYRSCSQCQLAPECSFCLGTGVCSATLACAPGSLVCSPGSTRSDCLLRDCPALAAPAPVRGAYSGGSRANFALDYIAPEQSYYCSYALTNTVFVKTSPATVAGPTSMQCTIPDSELAVLTASLTLYVNATLQTYTRATQPGASLPVEYYDCAAVPACTGCWSSERPDCGYCAASQACATRAACAPVAAALWMDNGVCPLITAVSPATVAAEGGETVTLTVSPLAPGLASLECRFGELRANATPSAASDGSLTCVTPAQTRGGDLVVAVFANDELVAAMAPGLGFTVAAPLAIARPRGPVLATGAVAGLAVGLVCCVLLVALVAVYAIRKRARDAIVKPPELTPALREQIVYGAPAVLSADDKRRLPHLDDFFNRLAMNEEFIALLGEATAATEQDKLTKCVNVVYETRGRALDLLLFQVSREVRTSYSQSTLFRTNSFATKLFKMFSKIHGLDYVHATLGRTLNELLLDVSDELAKGKTTNLRDAKAGDGDAALSRFAMLTKAQRLFQQIQRSEARLPIEFRYLFRHVQACLRERFPVRTEDLAAVISSTLLENLAATSTSFSDGTNAFETISGLQGSLSGDMAQLSAVLGPVSMQLDSFGASMKDVMANVTRMSKVVSQLHGAVDPRSTQAQALVAQHSAKQNSIAVGGFFFLRFLVPSFTAPEAYALVHEVPDNEQRKLLVVLGKVVQNLSNGLEFGAKEAHMVQFNEFITENQTAMNALFDKLATVPSNAPSLAALHDRATEVPRRRYEESIAFVYAHTLSVLDKLGEALQTPTGVPAVDGEHRLLLQILREVVVSVETKAGTENNAGLQARIAALSGIAQAASANTRVVVTPAPAAQVQPERAADHDADTAGADGIELSPM